MRRLAASLALLLGACTLPATAVGGRQHVPGCTGPQLVATFARIPGSAGGGLVSYKLTLRNTSAARCRLGFADVRLLDRGGRSLPTTGSPESSRDLGPMVVLRPGQAAVQTARFSATYPGRGEPAIGPCEPQAFHLAVLFGRRARPAVARVEPPTPVCSSGMLMLGAVGRAG